MAKTKGILLAASIAFATTFTISCSSDDDAVGDSSSSVGGSESSSSVGGESSSSVGSESSSSVGGESSSSVDGSESSSSVDGSESSSSATDIDSQVYNIQCERESPSCSFSPYTGGGTIKGTFLTSDGKEVLGMMDMGTVEIGKVNLEFSVPKEEYYNKNFNFRLYSGDAFIGRLVLVADNFIDNDVIGLHYYFPEDYQDKDEWDLFPNQDVMFVNDIDVKKGWNLYYYKNEYKDIDGKRVHIVTKSSDAAVLNGAELKWALLTEEQL